MACPKRSAVPEDSLAEILARMPARSVCRAKCVAKCWRDLIEDPLHHKRLPQTLQGFFSIDKEIYGRPYRACTRHIGFTSLLARSAPLGIDTRLSFMTNLPGIKVLTLLDSCNGLLLFKHGLRKKPDQFGYVVCNPATKHWVSMPRYKLPPGIMYTYLVFDPVISHHFHIVLFRSEARFRTVELLGFGCADSLGLGHWRLKTEKWYRTSVHVYSSETGTWSHIQNEWEEQLGQLERWRKCLKPHGGTGCAILQGVLHFIISAEESDQIAVVDVQGTTRMIIPVPAKDVRKTRPWDPAGYVAQSQGRLHYINQSSDAQLSIWVLEDYDAHKWVLKHSVNFVELFGEKWRVGCKNEYKVVTMHPDGNVVFVVWDEELISYDMDHKLASVIDTSERDMSTEHIVPYVPCFLESPALTNKH